MTSDIGPRYLRVKRKIDEEPCFSSREYKRCKYIASVKSTLLQDVLKVINNQNIQDADIIDVNQNRGEEEEEKAGFNVLPPEVEDTPTTFRGYVYDIYCLQDLDNNLYCVEEEEETDDSDSNDENNPRNDYPDDEGYDYNEVDFYRDWEDEEEYQLKERFEALGKKDEDIEGSSSEDSLSRNCDDEDNDDEDKFDPDQVDVPFAPPRSKA